MSQREPGFDVVVAPWTPEQVQILNQWQVSNIFHPFTCGYRSDHDPWNEGVLIATGEGWVCPVAECTYTQLWAHSAMTDSQLLTDALERRRQLFERHGLQQDD